MKRRLTVHFSGHVQGVGFRYGCTQAATGFEVAGTVENLPDGRVLLIAEGEAAELEAFLVAIADSHLGGFIRQQAVGWSDPAGGLRGFRIKQ